ncbi:Secreted glycosyl hydrolase [Kitasatospora sp. MMS16-BH015]|uniref:galactose-binding domain-containing protein n=1 Tax=Kitasatospora sp. MMS16-BH015 TaxID=2018025 RepID=UPI000CA3A057|nr:discoidin domain-containing protein [Kitasatospora sp. MMS16-BH015]AUG75530.1 Secreted glycosyl hydrolase [Kitasatospora sp. MMS16-BH015]
MKALLRSPRSRRLPGRALTALVAVLALLLPALGASLAQPAAAAATNLALGRAATVSSANGQYTAANLDDGSQSSYWESAGGSFPQWAQIDLGAPTAVSQVVLKLPAGWGARTQTLALQGSTDNATFATVTASAAYTFDPASNNTVSLNFGTVTARYLRVAITANTGWSAGQLAEFEVYGPATSATDLALHRPTTESGHTQAYTSANAVDGDPSTYWESTDNALPQWLQVDLGASVAVDQVVLKLPPATAWNARTETIAVQGSTDGTGFTDLSAAAGRAFDPATGNTVTVTFGQAVTRYVRLYVTANTAWPAAQLGSVEVYGPTGATQPPAAPTNLAYTQGANGAVKLTWTASSSSGVAGYDVYANNALLSSVPATATGYTDTPAATATVSYFVRARDAAGNQSANSNTVTRTGATATPPTAPSNLAYTQPSSGKVALTWSAASDQVGVTGYTVYRNGGKLAAVGGSTLSYTDSVDDSLTVSYAVTASNAAGLESAASNAVTRTGSGGSATNLALHKAVDGTANTYVYAPANAVDGDPTTYFEGASYPSQLTVHLGADADLSSVKVKVNPAASWSTRTQTIAVLGREQNATGLTTLVPAASYTFDPGANQNTVTIPVSGRVADVQLSITTNSGAPGGQVGELEVYGTPAPNPDLTIASSSWSPAAPTETDAVTASAVVKNGGTAASVGTDVNFYLGSTKVGSTTVGALAPGATQTVSAPIGTQNAGSYQLTVKVDESKKNFNLTADQSVTNPTALVVSPVQSADLVGALSWTPSTPAAGSIVTFTATVKNQGTIATTSGAHGVTLKLLDSTGATVTTLTGSVNGAIAAGATAAPVSLGSWPAVNGKYTGHLVIAADPNELPVKQPHLTSDTPLFVGQGANMPYDSYKSTDGTLGGAAATVGPNRTIGDLAGEATQRKAVTLNNTGDSVSWTSREATNTFVLRYSIPDAPGGGGTNATLDLYANGQLVQPLALSSHYAWLYGSETSPGKSPTAGSPRHVYDESSFLLGQSYPTGTVFTLKKDSANTSQYAIDFMNLEQTAPTANPDPAHLLVPAGFGQQDVQNALDKVRMDTTGTYTGVYLPAGQYAVTGRLTIYGKGVKVVGAGVWYTQFIAPQTMTDTDTGWDLQSGASGSTFTGFAWFGNYNTRQDGPGHTWDLRNQSNITIDNVWIEHNVVGVWGSSNVQNSTFTNMRIRDTMADGINLTNGSQGNLISNDEARSTGDDSFALFAAQDQNPGSKLMNNTIQNVTAIAPWRAAGVAIYGGGGNTIQNFTVSDTLCYSGLTVSSLNFGFAFEGFESTPQTVIRNFSLARDGGHFWGSQVFGAIWAFSATQPFQGIRVSDATITDPTYSGIMFQTDYSGSTALNPVTDTVFTNTTITGAHATNDAYGTGKSGYGIWANPMPEPGQGPAVGSVTFNHLVENNNDTDIKNTTSTFNITVNP